jgi:MFS family permease
MHDSAEGAGDGAQDQRSLLAVALGSMIAAQALVVFASLAVPIMAPDIAERYSVPTGLVGTYTSLMFFGAMIAALYSPALVARFGAVRVSQGTLLFAALGLLVALVPSVWALVPSALAIGLAYGPANPASSSILRRLTTPLNRARVFSFKQTSVPIGGAVAGFAVPIIHEVGGWPNVVLSSIALLLFSIGILQIWRSPLDADRLPGGKLPHPKYLLRPVGFVMRSPELRQLAFMSCAFAGVQFTFFAVCVAVLVSQGGLSLPLAGAALSAAMTTGFFVRILSGYAADRFGGINVLCAFATVMVAGTLGLALMTPGWPLWLSFAIAVVLGAGGLSWNGVYLAEVAARSSSREVALTTAGCMFMTFCGGLAGPAVFSLLAIAVDSYRPPLVVTSCFAGIAFLALVRLRSIDRAGL